MQLIARRWTEARRFGGRLDYTVRIELSVDQAVFRYRDEHLALAPIVQVAAQPTRWRRWLLGPVRMLGIGSQKAPAGAHVVHLFDPTSQAPPGLSKADCLEVFFRYALKVLQSKSRFRVKPVVQVYGASGLGQALGGYQDYVLRQALMRAGASRVEPCG